jgi:hypothetical protein
LFHLEQALESAKRSLAIARELIDAHRSGRRPPEAVITAYLHGVERDEAQLAELRESVQQFKSWFRTH